MNGYRRAFISLVGLLPSLCFADGAVPSPSEPWLTGPLIIPAGTVVPKGQIEIQTYLYMTATNALYDNYWQPHALAHNFYSLLGQVIVFFGITEWMDFQLTPQSFYNFTKGQSSVHFGDLPAGFDFQLYPATTKSWVPGVKFTLREIFPTGKYQKLNPHKKGTDVSGAGSFATNVGLEFYKVYHLYKHHFLSAALYLGYIYSAPVHVKGFNAYGGGHHTRGKVYPGNNYQTILSFEFTLNQNWVLALDNVYVHMDKNRFKGHAGLLDGGVAASVKNPSSEQFSFAPAIEYNFSNTLGIIAGAWVTGWGRNAIQFRSGVISLDYTF